VHAFFVEPIQREFPSLPISLLPSITWKRVLAVILATLLACVMHCLALMWVDNLPRPKRITEAQALPMIDIALEAPSAGAPEEVKPEPPKPKVQPVKKPKPIKKKKTEIKRRVMKEEPKEIKPQPVLTPVNKVTQNNPVVSTKADSKSKSSDSGTVTAARGYIGYLNNPKPNYPGIARSRHWEGLVMLRVYVTPDGRSGSVNVSRSSGHEVLDDAALAAVRNWRFIPGKRGDTPIASWVTVPIQFQLRD